MQLSLTAEQRDLLGKQTAGLRHRGLIPAVVYGHGAPNRALTVSASVFQKVWQAAGESTLVDLQVGSEPPVKAIIQDVQFDPASGKILHIDFHQVNMKEKVEVDVELSFVGEAPAVKELGGTLVKDHDTISVECLPQDLVKEIPVDVARLKTFDDVIRVQDLALPKGLELKSPSEDIVVHIEAPRTEAELAELDQVVEEDISKVEKVEKPKTEEEPEAEPAAPPAE